MLSEKAETERNKGERELNLRPFAQNLPCEALPRHEMLALCRLDTMVRDATGNT
jgi:hypothetical protein